MRWATRVALPFAPAALYGLLGWTHRWTADDAFINFRVVDQLLHGNGPVFNAGERVEAYTSPLWLGILSIPSAIAGVRHVPWIALSVGLPLAVAGLALATLGALALARRDELAGALPLPLGALAFAVLPPAWDFASSGLETGLSFAWLGACFAGAAVLYRRGEWRRGRLSSARAWDGLAVLAGLGVLVRPDFGIFSLGFLALAIVLPGRPTLRTALWRVALAVALPLAYELFRMAYFAELVPNTALAKEAGSTDWSRGWTYLWDTLEPYVLLAPLLALTAWSGFRAVTAARAGDRGVALLRGGPPAAGLLHLLYVVAIGGDFMHGRMVLPGLFAILMPVAVVPVRWSARDVVLAAGVAAWALVCGLSLRLGYVLSSKGISDERAYYVNSSHNGHPVTLRDYRGLPGSYYGTLAHARAARGERVLTFAGLGRPDLPLRPEEKRFVAVGAVIGVYGFAAGVDVRVADLLGIGDPLAARLRIVHRSRAGHEKFIPLEWVVARFADPARTTLPIVRSRATLAAGRDLRCPELRDLLHAIDKPLTLSRALSNLGFSFTSTTLRFPPNPIAAGRELCR